MPTFRLYCLDGAGHIDLAEWIEASSEEDAIAQARAMRPEATKCEIWQKDRLIAKLGLNGAAEFPNHP